MNGYIYLTTCLINGKKYIGQSINNRDINTYLGSGVLFKCAIKKHGKSSFKKEILYSGISDINTLNKLELECIELHNTKVPNGYNLDNGGTGKGKMSKETKAKIINSKTGKKHTTKQIEANRKSHIGLILSNETKKKIGEANKGKESWNKGKKMSLEFCEKRKNIMTGIKMIKKQILIFDKETNTNIICDGVNDASRKIGVSIGMISLLLSNKVSHIKNRYYNSVGVLTYEATIPLG